MSDAFKSAAQGLFGEQGVLFDARALLDSGPADTRSLPAAFLLALADDQQARDLLQNAARTDAAAGFFLNSLHLVEKELEQAAREPGFRKKLARLAEDPSDATALRKVFFPEGAGLPEARAAQVRALRDRRRVRLKKLNPNPLSDPGREILFTSNVLLTIPAAGTALDKLEYPGKLKTHIRNAAGEEQRYWYDHPIPIGVKPEANEILYGLRGLDETAAFEKTRGNLPGGKITCVLSVSVTHKGLHPLARQYIETEIRNAGGFRNLEVYVFTETDTDRLIREVLGPAGGDADALQMFGVDGEYGRHYSFLKAIAAFWKAAKDPAVKAVFKIDLDQVFPEKELVEQSGASAFEHFKTPRWGAHGTDADGDPVDLGMIAGALVNERDIHRGLFTSDVPFPAETSALDEKLFFSKMVMALSTEAEIMTRYGRDGIDGKTECIQRIHVTGGTNGILVDSLTKHRPFTPSFIGRAEDQAYLLSVLLEEGEKLRYVHEDGLIMRHDKEAFAGDAIRAASLGNIVGDYIRTLYFSEYAHVLGSGGMGRIKNIVDPFTGCFITPIPATVVMLRFCLKAAEFFLAGETENGNEFVRASHRRLAKAMTFAHDGLRRQYEREREGWNQFYGLLDRVRNDQSLSATACEIIDGCRIRS